MRNYIKIITVISLVLLSASCSKKTKTSGGGSVGLTSVTTVDPNNPSVIAGSKVSINFSSTLGTYTAESVRASEIDIGTKKCVSASYKNHAAYSPDTMVIDEYLPNFSKEEGEHLTLFISPNASGVPVDYLFSAKINDRGCGSASITAVCTIWNMTANSDIVYGRLEKGVIPEPFVWAPGQTCLSKSGKITNNFAEHIRHVIDAARINDRLRFEIYLQDGGGNYSSGESLDFYKYQQLLGTVGVSSPN